MTKKILIINEGFSDNLGDQAINHSIEHLLKKNFVSDIHFQDYTKNLKKPLIISTSDSPNRRSNSLLVKLIRLLPIKLRWLIVNLSRVIKASNKHYDQIIIGGGQLILSNATFAIAMFCWVFFLRLMGNKNIAICGVGVGTSFTHIDRLLFGYSLKRIPKIYLRDKKSQHIMKAVFGVDSEFIYDVAFIHNKCSQQTRQSGKHEVLLGVISYDVYKKYAHDTVLSKNDFFKSWITLLDKSQMSLQKTKLFYTTKEDRDVSIEFQEYVNDLFKIQLPLIETNQLDVLIEEINNSKTVVSARMHALILAFAYNRNITVYPVSEKLIEFNNMMHSDLTLKKMQEIIESQFSLLLDGGGDGRP